MNTIVNGIKVRNFNHLTGNSEMIRQFRAGYNRLALDASNAMHQVALHIQRKLSTIIEYRSSNTVDTVFEIMKLANDVKGVNASITFMQYNGPKDPIDDYPEINNEIVALAIESFADDVNSADFTDLCKYLSVFVQSMIVGNSRGSVAIRDKTLVMRIGRRVGDDVPFGAIIKITKP